MRVFNWTFLLRAALAVPVAGLIGATVSTLTTGTTIASTKLNCTASDWTPRGFCGRNSAYCADVCAGPYNHAPPGNWYATRSRQRIERRRPAARGGGSERPARARGQWEHQRQAQRHTAAAPAAAAASSGQRHQRQQRTNQRQQRGEPAAAPAAASGGTSGDQRREQQRQQTSGSQRGTTSGVTQRQRPAAESGSGRQPAAAAGSSSGTSGAAAAVEQWGATGATVTRQRQHAPADRAGCRSAALLSATCDRTPPPGHARRQRFRPASPGSVGAALGFRRPRAYGCPST